MESNDSPLENTTTAADSVQWATSYAEENDGKLTQKNTGKGEDSMEPLERTPTYVKELWKFHLRAAEDEEPQDWWFASTAIPLLAATIGPMANVMSIAALVTSWRNDYDPNFPGMDDNSIGYPDPHWCVAINATSLAFGFAGNIFLLLNFTRRIRYIVALPMTIILWYFATGFLTGAVVSMEVYVPPVQPLQTYSQGFWHAVIAAVLYLLSSMILMVNMLGYFLGHYPQHFELTEEQRNLILQTMMFFIWLAGGAGVFASVCGWSFTDAIYFCDVTILTVGFGDFFATNDTGRGLVFPFSVGGIIILGLMVSSIRKFARQLGHEKVIKGHVESRRARTFERSVTSSFEAQQRYEEERKKIKAGRRPTISAPFNPQKRTIAFDQDVEKAEGLKGPLKSPNSVYSMKSPRSTVSSMSERMRLSGPLSNSFSKLRKVSSLRRVGSSKPKLLILREEKDRFDAMRSIQSNTKHFKQYFALSMSIIAFGLLWCVGAVVFWCAEHSIQDLTYFQALYFCYVSLLTIGYGDLAPKSNAGKPFFLVWSLIAVPTMTILISDMGDTVVASYKRGTFTLADWTVLPKRGFFRDSLATHPRLARWIQRRIDSHNAKRRISSGFPTGPADTDIDTDPLPAETVAPTLESLAAEIPMDEHDLARKLAIAIRSTADDLRKGGHHRYAYEQWVEFTRLIRFSKFPVQSAGTHLEAEEEEEGLVNWDWIGENSPMMSTQSEAEWVLDRLCESLDRYMRKQLPEEVRARRKSQMEERLSFSRRGSRTGNRAGSGGWDAGREAEGMVAAAGVGKYSGREGPEKHFRSMAAVRMGH